MKNKFQLTSIALLVGGIALSGCAPKQAWSPELAEAREAYQRASSNPLVNSLAVAELDQAKKQLQDAEDSADFFKSREEIAHEATLAHLMSLEAEQAARALQAKDNLKLAQAGAPIHSLPGIGDTQNEPTLAAASSAHQQDHSNVGSSSHSGSVSGGSSSEIEQIAAQLADLSRQISQLQSGSHTSTSATQSDETQPHNLPVIDLQAHSSEPALGAAMAAPDTGSELEVYNDTQPLTSSPGNAPSVIYDAPLREELRAMNVRPTSRGMGLTLGDRYFESGSAKLWNGRVARHLDNIAAVMAENTGLMIDVEAHTDNQGTEEIKNSLTADRATAIKSALVLRGVDGSRINTTGFGDSAPIGDNNSQLGRLQNRRVEIIFPNIEGI